MSRREPLGIRVVVAALVTLIVLAIFGVAFAIRVYAPCWVFSVATAPTRCLVGA